MAATYTLISSNILSTSAASVTFSSIPATYTDLMLRMSTRDDRADTQNYIQMTINGNTANNYSLSYLQGNGTSASGARDTSMAYSNIRYENSTNTTANTFTSGEIYFPNYLASTNKPISVFTGTERNLVEAFLTASAVLYTNTTAISSFTLAPTSSNFVSGSSFYLYGISNA